MSIFEAIPAPLRRLARALLPARLVDAVRDRIMRRFYLRSMVRREPGSVAWLRRAVLHRKPVLYHFEIHLTDHCNLNCRGCAHFSNLCPPTFADPGDFDREMGLMASHFSAVRQIYLLGGEPLLHPKVAELVRIARRHFPRTRLYLMTNGTLVMRMGAEFWDALRDTRVVLLCDSYPIGLPKEEIDRLGREHGVAVEWTEEREEFFKIPIDPAGGHEAAASFRACQGFNNCPIVRDGRIYPCAYVAFADVFRDRFGLEGLEVSDRDSISIGEDVTGDEIVDFLLRPVPWCRHCDMGSRTFYTWGRSKRALDEWTSAPACEEPVSTPAGGSASPS